MPPSGYVDELHCSDTDTKLILGGFSQGVDVIGKVVDRLGGLHEGSGSLDQIAGMAVFGDPLFNPRDAAAVDGDFDPSRSGFFGPRPVWSEQLDAPVISVCREGDFFCQWRVDRVATTGTSGQSEVVAAVDPGPILDWAESKWGYNRWLPFDQDNNDKLYSEHNNYAANNQPAKAAVDLADRMDLAGAQSSHQGQDPVDVAILVDSTSAASGYVSELQSRAEDIVNLVSDNVPDARIAVIDFKSPDPNTLDPYQVHVNGFSSNPQDAVDAIDAIEPGGGPYGAIYSAVNAMNDLPWRKGVKKVTLGLISSRACGGQYCNRESGSGVAYPNPLALSKLRQSGVYTLNNEYFFETAGWAAALGGDTPYTARPGGYASATEAIDDLERVFKAALTDPRESIKGTADAVAGQSGYFSANSLLPYYATSEARRLQWTSHWAGPLPTGGGPTASRASASPTAEEPDPCESSDPCAPTEPEELPDDQGPFYQLQFDRAGLWDVEVTAYVDGQVVTKSTQVRVEPKPSTAPASPLLTSFEDGGDQVLAWTAGDGESATAYRILDSEGNTVDTVIPVADVGRDGVVDFEYSVPLEPGEQPTYTVAAINATGSTAATAVITAKAATYQHPAGEGEPVTGAVLNLSGSTTPELSTIRSKLENGAGAASATGNYEASVVSPSGARFNFNMSAVQTSVAIGNDTWTATIGLGDVLDTEGDTVWETMRDGFADELLAGGYLDLRINGAPVRVKVSPTAETSQPGEYVIDPDSAPPLGASVSSAGTDPSDGTLTLEYWGDIDDALLPFVGDATEETDWSSVAVAGVRTWLGSAEVTNDAHVQIVSASRGDDDTPGQVTLQLTGGVAGGGYEAMRDFLTNGTILFQVDGGADNILSLQVSTADAETAYPTPVVEPGFIGASTAKFIQYRDKNTWKPVIKWGSAAPGTVVLTGELPNGLWLDWDSQSIKGTPLEQGVFPISITATNDAGQVTRNYSVAVSANTVGPAFQFDTSSTSLNEDNSVSLTFTGSGYFRTDNPDIMPWLPIATQLDDLDGYLSGQIDDVVFTDPEGNTVDVAGTFLIDVWTSGWGTDSIRISSQNATVGDNSAATVNGLFESGATISFSFDGGATNLVRLGQAPEPATW